MIKAINLKTEYLVNPIGIDVQNPRLMWTCEGAIKQTAYRIVATENGHQIWDSGKIQTDEMRAVYPLPLTSLQRITWTVTLWDENDKEGEQAQAYFETGLLNAVDWQAKWISGNYSVNKKYRYPTDHFKKEFNVNNVSCARLYITACGLYEAKLNGKRVGNFVLAPGHTDYRKRIQYQTYDVTDLMQSGANDLTVELADGWYRGAQGAWGHTYIYGDQTKLFAQLEITDTNGNKTVIVTDKSWAWSNDGERLYADLKEGEVVDANKTPLYSGNAREAKFNTVLSCSNNYAVTKHEKLTPKLIKTPSGKTVLDFGQNISGFIGFKLNARKGQKIFMRMGELLDRNGEFTQKNIQLAMNKTCEHFDRPQFKNGYALNFKQSVKGRITPLQMLDYTCKEGVNEFETKFALYGFQYALIESDVDINAEDFYSVAVYSDFERTGTFECSHPLINQFVEATLWSEKSNSCDVPTDCPTRERSGWSGDAQIFFNTASYLTSYAPFARKYLRDLTDRQAKSGKFHQIAPKGGEDSWMNTMNGSVGWADAGVLIPYRMWKKYGDDKIIKDNYEAMKRYARFMIKRCGGFTLLRKPVAMNPKYKKYLVNRGQSYGEWAEPKDVCAFAISDFIFPHPEESTAYTVFTMRHMAEIADYLGKTEDKKLYEKYAEGCKRAYQQLVKKKKFSIDTDRQAKLVRPLYMDLLDEEQTAFAKKRLIKAMDNYGWRLGTGFLSTPFILDVLKSIDIEYAYKLLENEEIPGWLSMPKAGATTVWEDWEGPNGNDLTASLNLYSKGALCEWLFNCVGGIKVDGDNKFKIEPKVGGTLTYAKASYDSIYGRVESGWKKQNGKTIFTVKIPCNCTAEIILPNGERHNVNCGEHIFEI